MLRNDYFVVGIIAADFLKHLVFVGTKVGRVGGKLLGQFDGAVLVVQGNVSHSRFLFFPSSWLFRFISEGLVSFVVSISYHGGFLNLSL